MVTAAKSCSLSRSGFASRLDVEPFRFTLLGSVVKIGPGWDGLRGPAAYPAVLGCKGSEPGHGVSIRSAGA